MMAESERMQRLKTLVLARLLVGGKGLSETALRDSLLPILGLAGGEAAHDGFVIELLHRLEEEGAVQAGPWRLTQAGRSQALSRLGLKGLPRTWRWRQVKERALTALVLGLNPNKSGDVARISGGEAITAWVLRQELGLDVAENASLQAVVDAIVARHLGLGPDEKLTLPTIRSHVISRLLGADAPVPVGRGALMLAARELGVRHADVVELKTALIGRWLADGETNPHEDSILPEAELPPETVPPASNRRPSLAELVNKAAVDPRVVRGRHDRAFISSVYDLLMEDRQIGMNLEDFKDQLVEMHQLAEVALARGEPANDSQTELQEYERSRIQHLSSEFHCVETTTHGKAVHA